MSAPRRLTGSLCRLTGGERGDGLIWIGEDGAASEAPPADLPDPGDRDVADAELATARVDAAADQHTLAQHLRLVHRDPQLFPGLSDVGEVVAKARPAPVGRFPADRLGRRHREELHRVVAELDDAGLV